MNSKQGRCALVTGASRGIGEAIARRLTADGLRVFGASRPPLDSPGAGIEPLVLDVTDDDSVRAAIDVVFDKAGRLDVVVNNAGATLVGALEETSTDEARWLFETNLLGVHRVTRTALPYLRASKGHAVMMGSVAVSWPSPPKASTQPPSTRSKPTPMYCGWSWLPSASASR